MLCAADALKSRVCARLSHVWFDWYDRRSALEDAANEEGHDELHDSDDDLLESSEEEDEDDDLIQSPQRMPEPGVVKTAKLKHASMSSNPDGSNGRGSRTRTTGARPSVALQMQEMEGRPSADDDAPIGAASSDDAKGQSGSLENEDNSGNTEKTIREYMVSDTDVSLPSGYR